MKRLGLQDLTRLQETVGLFLVEAMYFVPSGSFVELILRVYLFCWFCHIYIYLY